MPYIAVVSPFICWLFNYAVQKQFGFGFGYELLLINGMICFAGMLMFSGKQHADYQAL